MNEAATSLNVISEMEFFNVFKGLKKSNSDSKLGLSGRLSFNRKSKLPSGAKSIVNSPLPPRPSNRSAGSKTNRHGRAFENIPENLICGPSLHSPRHDPDQFDNVNSQEPLLIKGNKNSIKVPCIYAPKRQKIPITIKIFLKKYCVST